MNGKPVYEILTLSETQHCVYLQESEQARRIIARCGERDDAMLILTALKERAELQAKLEELASELKGKVEAAVKLHDARFAALKEAETAQARVKELEAENARLRAGFPATAE